MNPDVSLQVIARQLIIANRLKHIELEDKVSSFSNKAYLKDRSEYLQDLEDDINKDEQYIQ